MQNVNYLFKKYWKLSWYYVMNFSNYNLKKRTGYKRRKLLTFKIRGSNLLENHFCCCLETSRFPTIPFLSSSCQSSSRKYKYNFSARIKPEGLFLFFPFFFFFLQEIHFYWKLIISKPASLAPRKFKNSSGILLTSLITPVNGKETLSKRIEHQP